MTGLSAALDPSFWVSTAASAVIFGILASGFQLQFGYAGLMNFGHVAFMAVGAYATAIAIVRLHAAWYVTLPLAAVCAAISGLIVAVFAIRLRVEYFALATLAYAECVRYLTQNLAGLTGGTQGTPAMLGQAHIADYGAGWRATNTAMKSWLDGIFPGTVPVDAPMLVVATLVLVVTLLLLYVLASSPWGLVVKGMREDELAIETKGYSAARYRTQAIVIGAIMAAAAGVLYAFYYLALYPSEFDSEFTLFAVLIVLLGGVGRVAGVVAGCLLFGLVNAGTRLLTTLDGIDLAPDKVAHARIAMIGLIFILLALFRPQGILGKKDEIAFD